VFFFFLSYIESLLSLLYIKIDSQSAVIMLAQPVF